MWCSHRRGWVGKKLTIVCTDKGWIKGISLQGSIATCWFIIRIRLQFPGTSTCRHGRLRATTSRCNGNGHGDGMSCIFWQVGKRCRDNATHWHPSTEWLSRLRPLTLIVSAILIVKRWSRKWHEGQKLQGWAKKWALGWYSLHLALWWEVGYSCNLGVLFCLAVYLV